MSATESVADVREGQSWTKRQSAKNAILYVVIRVAIAFVTPLPAPLLRSLGRLVGAFAFVFFGHARRTARRNVALIFPNETRHAHRALVRRCYRALGGHLGEAIALLRGDALDPLPMDDASLRVLDDARRDGRGVIFASAHLGPWERVAATLVARGVSLTTMARSSYDPRLDPLYDRLRGGRGVGVIYRGHPGAPSRIVRTLRAGGVLGMPMDLRSRVASIPSTLLGHRASTPVGPARIALRTGASVVVGTAAPDRESHFRITCTRIPTHDLREGDVGERELTSRINDELSRRILAMPAEWPWMHERFDDER